MSVRPTPLAVSVPIPPRWTPEQALAVLELLNALRDALWAIHGDRIRDLLQQQQGFVVADPQLGEPNSDDQSFRSTPTPPVSTNQVGRHLATTPTRQPPKAPSS